MNSGDHWITPGQAREAMASGTGKGIRIAILDSGVDATHPALAGANLAELKTVVHTGAGPEIADDHEGDAFGHGTAIAYLIRQVAPEVTIGSYKVLHMGEDGCTGTAAALEIAVETAIAEGYDIINCSFGTPARPVIFRYFKSWIDAAYLAGVHVVTACNNFNYTRPEWPSHFPSVIAVSMGRTEDDAIHYRPGQLVEFFAQGERIRVPWLNREYKTVTGSSYAAPRVAGMLARLLSVHPGLSAPLVKALLRTVAEPWSEEIAGDNVWT